MNFRSNATIQKAMFKGEAIVLSCHVQKYNRFKMKQTRNFVLTNQRVCNFDKEKLQRDVDVTKLIGVTKSVEKSSHEFVIHFDHEYDYRFTSNKIEVIIEAL